MPIAASCVSRPACAPACRPPPMSVSTDGLARWRAAHCWRAALVRACWRSHAARLGPRAHAAAPPQRLGPQAVAGLRPCSRCWPACAALDERPAWSDQRTSSTGASSFATTPQVWGRPTTGPARSRRCSRAHGDCEDYAIAKYFSLLALGMPAAQAAPGLRARAGRRPRRAAQAHMVLAYYAQPEAEPLILDNLVDRGAAGVAPARPDAGVQLQQRGPVAGRRRPQRGRSGGAAVALARGAAPRRARRGSYDDIRRAERRHVPDPPESRCCWCWCVLLALAGSVGVNADRRRATRCRPSCA